MSTHGITNVSLGRIAPASFRDSTEAAAWLAASRRLGLHLVAIMRAIGRERRYRRDVRHVASLDDYMLADLGLRRSEIEHVVKYGRP